MMQALLRLFGCSIMPLLAVLAMAHVDAWALQKKILPKQPASHEEIRKEPENTGKRTSTGAKERKNLRKGKEFHAKKSEAARTKSYEETLALTSKKPFEKDSVWNKEYLDSNTPDAKHLKDALQKYEDGTRGASIRDFSLINKSYSEIDKEAILKGFSKKEGVLPSEVDKKIVYFNKNHRMTYNKFEKDLARQIFYEHPDGGMIRVKPDGDYNLAAPRQQPHVSKSVKLDPADGTEWSNEAFKVSEDGVALPKSPNLDSVTIRNDLSLGKSKREVEDIKDAIADATHLLLKKE